MVATAGNDGVDVKVATADDLTTYTKAQNQVDKFKVPAIFNSQDPHARVFIALFDGTGNDAIKDPAHLTNIGILKGQLEEINRKNPNIVGRYIEGPGTQGGLMVPAMTRNYQHGKRGLCIELKINLGNVVCQPATRS